MQQKQYFNPPSNKVFLTKRHVAFILLLWWLSLQLYSFILLPTSNYLYQNIIEYSDQRITQEVKAKEQNKTNTDQSLIDRNKNIESQIQEQLNIDDVRIKGGSLEDEDLYQVSKDSSSSSVQKTQIKSNSLKDFNKFQVNFKIKTKKNGNSVQQIQKAVTEESLKLAMEQIYKGRYND